MKPKNFAFKRKKVVSNGITEEVETQFLHTKHVCYRPHLLIFCIIFGSILIMIKKTHVEYIEPYIIS